ncbi:MAG: transposase [Anaerolineales bacterium]|nr:transposase [Anaerolineales bacterium]
MSLAIGQEPRELIEEQEKQLAGLLAVLPELKTCYELREAFRDLFNQNLTPKAAEKPLLGWIAQVEATSFKTLQAFQQWLCRRCKLENQNAQPSRLRLPKFQYPSLAHLRKVCKNFRA